VAFPITEPYASFLIGGGSTAKPRVEIINAVSGVVLFRCTGPDNEQMKRVFVDLRPFQGGTLRIRLVDEAQTGWGHLNFDDFLLHDAPPADAEETK
jgi:hypothetical protein